MPDLPAPSGLQTNAISASAVDLCWNAAPGATAYHVYWSPGSDAPTSGTTATVNGLKPHTPYRFEVAAVHSTVESGRAGISAKTRRFRPRFWRILILLLLVVLILAPAMLVAGPIAEQYRIRFTPKTAGGMSAAIVLLILLLLWAVLLDLQGLLGSKTTSPSREAPQEVWAKWRKRGLRGLVVGSDGRASTSKAQAALWTIVVLTALVYLALVGRSPNCPASAGELWNSTCNAGAPQPADTDALFGEGFPADLLVLLFGYAGVIFAKNNTENAVQNNPGARAAKKLKREEKEDNLAKSAGQLFTNDKGELDLLDTQYFAFALFTAIYFLYQLVAVTKNSFPTLGGGLLTLAGTSTLSYAVKKYLENQNLGQDLRSDAADEGTDQSQDPRDKSEDGTPADPTPTGPGSTPTNAEPEEAAPLQEIGPPTRPANPLSRERKKVPQ